MQGEEDDLVFLQKEKELVGMYLSSHPLDKYKFELSQFTTCDLANLANFISECELARKSAKVCIAGLVTEHKQMLTKKGTPFSKTMLEDYTGSYELALFSKEHEAFFSYMRPHDALFLEGVVEEKWSTKPEERAKGQAAPYSFKVKKVTMLGNVSAEMLKSFCINVETPMLTPRFREDLLKTVVRNRGNIPLEIYLFDPGTRYRIQFKSNKFQVAVTTEFINDLRRIGVVSYEAVRK
jgi:DNA polymerase-3 subunit alpha